MRLFRPVFSPASDCKNEKISVRAIEKLTDETKLGRFAKNTRSRQTRKSGFFTYLIDTFGNELTM